MSHSRNTRLTPCWPTLSRNTQRVDSRNRMSILVDCQGCSHHRRPKLWCSIESEVGILINTPEMLVNIFTICCAFIIVYVWCIYTRSTHKVHSHIFRRCEKNETRWLQCSNVERVSAMLRNNSWVAEDCLHGRYSLPAAGVEKRTAIHETINTIPYFYSYFASFLIITKCYRVTPCVTMLSCNTTHWPSIYMPH